MTEQCARGADFAAARACCVIVVNRTLKPAPKRSPARSVAKHANFDAFRASPDPVEVVILATGAREPVLGRADLERIAARAASGEPTLVLDPRRAAERRARDRRGRRRGGASGIDRISRVSQAAEDRGQASLLLDLLAGRAAVIDDALVEFRRQTAERLVGPVIAQLRLGYRRTALEGVDRLLAKSLPDLSDDERETLRHWAETLASRLAHVPSIGLRDLAFAIGPSAVEAFFESSDPTIRASLASAGDSAGSEVLEPERIEP